jgi:membrane protein YqaA with SNARE-associated domain
VSLAVMFVPIDAGALGDAGFLGVFLVTLITTSAFVLPVPYLAVIARTGSLLDPTLVALVAGVAATIGELTGYLLGRGGSSLVHDSRWVQHAHRWMRRHGFLAVSIGALIPNPVFDALGIAAGALSYPAWRFALACFLGKTGKFLIVAHLGKSILGLG